MKKINLKHISSIAGILLAAYIFIGAILDSFSNLIQWITPVIAFIGTIFFLLVFLILKILINKNLIYWGSLRVISSKTILSVLIGSILTLWVPSVYMALKPANEIDQNTISTTPLLFEKTTSLKVLILPFHPDEKCLIRTTDFEFQLIERYKNKANDEKLNLEIALLKDAYCPSTVEEARKIAIENQADIVIWGQFEDDCAPNKKIRIRYALKFDLLTVNQRIYNKNPLNSQILPYSFGDSKKQNLLSLDTLRQGYLQEDIDFLITYILGVVEFNNKNYEESARLFKRVFAIKKCEYNVLTYLGYSLVYGIHNNEDFIQSMNDLDYYIGNCKNNVNLLFFKGYLYQNIENLDSATYYFKKVINIDNSYYYHLQARVFLGGISIKKEKYDEARTYFEEVVSMKPDWQYVYTPLGRYFRKMRKYEEAQKCYEKLAALDSNLIFESLYELSLLNLEFDCIDEAESKLYQLLNLVQAKAPQANQYISNIYYYLSWVEIKRKNFQMAKKYLNEGLTYYSQNEKIMNIMENVRIATSNKDFELVYMRVD